MTNKKLTHTTDSGAKIRLTPEYWAQPGAVAYMYCHKDRRTAANVDRVAEGRVVCWSINAWGSTHQWTVPVEQFLEEYEEINAPSMYAQMEAVRHGNT